VRRRPAVPFAPCTIRPIPSWVPTLKVNASARILQIRCQHCDRSCPARKRCDCAGLLLEHRRLHLQRGSGQKPSRSSREVSPVQRPLLQRRGSSTWLFCTDSAHMGPRSPHDDQLHRDCRWFILECGKPTQAFSRD
jgi:hypothetical protein